MGTVIFPDAAFKVFLTASAAERAKRRYKQLKEKGLSVTLAGLQHEIEARDSRDASRAVAPLKPADDAVLVDTTGMGHDEVVAQVLAVFQHWPGRPTVFALLHRPGVLASGDDVSVPGAPPTAHYTDE